jgi:hypothetical protein
MECCEYDYWAAIHLIAKDCSRWHFSKFHEIFTNSFTAFNYPCHNELSGHLVHSSMQCTGLDSSLLSYGRRLQSLNLYNIAQVCIDVTMNKNHPYFEKLK